MAPPRISRLPLQMDARVRGLHVPASLADFYREEFLKHRQCLEHQRDCYSEHAIREIETALTRILAHLDQLCTKKDADQVLGRLLRKIDLVTGLSAWSDPKNVH